MKRTMKTMTSFLALGLLIAGVGCAGNPMEKATVAVEEVAEQMLKSQGDCDKFAALAKPILDKNKDAFEGMKKVMKDESDANMKKMAEFLPRITAAQQRITTMGNICGKHAGFAAVMNSLRGK